MAQHDTQLIIRAKTQKTIEDLLLENPDFANEKDKLKISESVLTRMNSVQSTKLTKIYEMARTQQEAAEAKRKAIFKDKIN